MHFVQTCDVMAPLAPSHVYVMALLDGWGRPPSYACMYKLELAGEASSENTRPADSTVACPARTANEKQGRSSGDNTAHTAILAQGYFGSKAILVRALAFSLLVGVGTSVVGAHVG